MGPASQKATPTSCCSADRSKSGASGTRERSLAATSWSVVPAVTAGGVSDSVAADNEIKMRQRAAAAAAAASSASLIRAVESLPDDAPISPAAKPLMLRAQSSHPLDPLSATEIKLAVETVRAAGATPEERDSMRFVEVVLLEPEKHVIAIADAYFFPPFQASLVPRPKRHGPGIPSKLPPRQARLVVYNKRSNETSVWIVELTEVHATTRGGHRRGKVISSKV